MVTLVRIPNPASNLESILKVFSSLHAVYNGKAEFSLEDSVSVGVDENLMASKGHVGEEARKRSYKEDSSRDAMYNQFKMYAEVFRILGWIRSASSTKRTSYRITYLGNLVAIAEAPLLLLEQCLLGISFPNDANNIKFKNQVWPICDILRTMSQLNGVGSRDEFIVGPLALADSRDTNEFNLMIQSLSQIRSKPSTIGRVKALEASFNSLIKTLGLGKSTVQNYTRIPIAALKGCWANELPTNSIYGRNNSLLQLTKHGLGVARWLSSSRLYAPRCSEVISLPLEQAQAVSLFGLIHLLQRAKFATEPLEKIAEPFEQHLAKVSSYKSGDDILFNPYQQFSPESVFKILGVLIPDELNDDFISIERAAIESVGQAKLKEKAVNLVRQSSSLSISKSSVVVRELNQALAKFIDVDKAVTVIFEQYKNANKESFYPAVAELLTEVGLECEKMRDGVVGLRWDAFIKKPYNMPIEIKSPGEEEYIQVKGVRQALENKVILLSRKIYGGAELDTSSLLVGYNPPNNRAEVNEIIADIKTVYEINIGVIDFKTLLKMVALKIQQGLVPDLNEIRTLVGILNVS